MSLVPGDKSFAVTFITRGCRVLEEEEGGVGNK